MDVPRSPEVAKRKKAKRILFSVATLIVVVFVTVVLAKLKPAAPTVERATVWHDVVKRGEMLRSVRGPDTLILERRDQKVQQALLDAELELKAVEADLASLRVRLNNELLQQQSDAA